MQKLAPADELADIRTQIKRLEARAAVLRALILARPEAEGRWHRAVVHEVRSLSFDVDLLPERVRDDPRFWRERVTATLQCEPVAGARAPLRSGWPIQREAAGGMH